MGDERRAHEGTARPHTGDEPGVVVGGRIITRRRFLRGAGTGVIAAGVAGQGSWARAMAATSTPKQSVKVLGGEDLATATETWTEPGVWRPDGTDPLTLHVVEDVNGFRFSYDGSSPGPTIRTPGNQTVYVQIRNDLSEDRGTSPVGPNPDPVEGYPGPEGAMLQTFQGDDIYGTALNHIPVVPQPDWALGEHVNGVHSAHVTNLHTHGLHVRPGRNDNGTSSDDIYLRIVPAGDAVKISENPELYEHYQESREEIVDDVADFEFRLGDVMEGLVGPDGQTLSGVPHPPGTYWYHPHSHGATQNQVASGMAGFFIIEGDVDALVNERIAGDANAVWDQRTGAWEYRERSMFVQRVFVGPTANVSGPSAGPDPDELMRQPNSIQTLVNGKPDPDIITMRPGAIERWRVLNGSVDGAGFMRFAVLTGQFGIDDNNDLVKIVSNGGSPTELPVTVTDYQPLTVNANGEAEPVAKAHLWQLAWDGITLVVEDGPGRWAYRVADLASVNGGREPDFDDMSECWVAANMPLCHLRPNEVALANANRADVFFQAPPLGDGAPAVYTVVSLPTQLNGTQEGDTTIIAHVVVSGDDVAGGHDYPFAGLLDGLAVNPYEIPVSDEELQITSVAERAARGIGDRTAYRTRVVRYAGWGANGLPLIEPNAEYVAANPDKEKLTYYVAPASDSTDYTMPVTNGNQTQAVGVTGIRRFPDGALPTVLLPAHTRTMSIDGEKFYPSSVTTPRMLLNTAEEWAVYNQSIDVYSVQPPDSSWTAEQQETYIGNNPELLYYQFEYVDDPPSGAPTSPQPWYGTHRFSYPMTPAQVAAVNAGRMTQGNDPWTGKGMLQISGRSTDHPFHIHQNPFWILRVDTPDENGDLVNILPTPRWADTVAVPRNGGRVVFRSRFVDYEGEFVHHCHILLHEDHGMMQRVQIVGNPADSNYEPRDHVVGREASGPDVDAIYGKPTLADSWKKSLLFVDRNVSGQVYPGDGFVVDVPSPPTE